MSRTASMLWTLALVEAGCRYCEQSSLVGYCSPLTRARTPPCRLPTCRGSCMSVCRGHLDAVLGLLRNVASGSAQEYVGKLVAAHMPPLTSDALDGPLPAEKRCSNSLTRRWACLSSDRHRHLCGPGGAGAQLSSPAQRTCRRCMCWG
ncbi:hypothetical_protein [Leishmania major strain Friedlin]|nr:hypothetical_protein [Leishmania major strain Friedlin]CAG9579253.1 hypothetical_protein [Leishmania major strain Friedlin]CAG9579255.1 hypothetical_protein [Leishmania major strain Friedlin]CAG9579257.1 hypothetical_protein [Leishmania major strain Friedlin]